MNNMKTEVKLKVYYDGLCKVCDAEITHYKNQKCSDRIEFIDICARQFDVVEEQLDPFEIHKVMHARRPDGSVATRLDAFIEIWKVLPRYNILVKIAKNRFARQGLDFGYELFSQIRPWLPRKKNSLDCNNSPYCETKNA